MARPEKVAVVEEVRGKLAAADAAVLTEYRGLTVKDLATLRAALRTAGAEYKVYKNTLARRAAEEAGLPELVGLLEGPTAITFITGDAVVTAKALRDYARTNPALVVKGGVLGTRVIGAGDMTALADVPPREQLLARIAGGFQAPLAKAAGLFQAFTRNMAYGLKALIDQRVASGEPPPSDEAAPETRAPEAPAAEPPISEAPTPEAPVAEAPAAQAADEPVEALADPAAGTGGATSDEPSAQGPSAGMVAEGSPSAPSAPAPTEIPPESSGGQDETPTEG